MRRSEPTIITPVLLAALATATVTCAIGCSKARADTSAPAASAATRAAPKATTAVPKAAPPKLELVTKDLSAAGAKWKGWTAKGPADAKVDEDLGGARIVTEYVSGPKSFDLAFRFGKENLAKRKGQLKSGAAENKTQIAFLGSSPTLLEWKEGSSDSESYSFELLEKVGGHDITCYTVTPRDSHAELTLLEHDCASLKKK